jgi:hypothetical protein
MRCYFNLVHATGRIPDTEGVEVTDVGVARAEAVRALRELIDENSATPRHWAGWRLEVTDAADDVLFAIDLGSFRH